MKNILLVSILSFILCGCGHTILTPKMVMPTPPAELMIPPQKMSPIRK